MSHGIVCWRQGEAWCGWSHLVSVGQSFISGVALTLSTVPTGGSVPAVRQFAILRAPAVAHSQRGGDEVWAGVGYLQLQAVGVGAPQGRRWPKILQTVHTVGRVTQAVLVVEGALLRARDGPQESCKLLVAPLAVAAAVPLLAAVSRLPRWRGHLGAAGNRRVRLAQLHTRHNAI